MIITTASRTTSDLLSKAKELSHTFDLPYKERNGVSVEQLKAHYQTDVVVVGKDRVFISPINDKSKLFFHPNLAMVRAKRIFNGEKEPLIETAQLREGMTFLDCTLGLASDSIIASISVGSAGSVIGIEYNDVLHLLAKQGLASHVSGNQLFDQAMRRIEVIRDDHYSFLKKAKTNSVDIVYFDPMFSAPINTSSGMNSIRNQASSNDITIEIIAEAKRVARKRVVLKDHWKSDRFTKLGFTQHRRKTSLFHYGTLELDEQ